MTSKRLNRYAAEEAIETVIAALRTAETLTYMADTSGDAVDRLEAMGQELRRLSAEWFGERKED